jgi:hypothetical protein
VGNSDDKPSKRRQRPKAKPKRDMDERVRIDADPEEALRALVRKRRG